MTDNPHAVYVVEARAYNVIAFADRHGRLVGHPAEAAHQPLFDALQLAKLVRRKADFAHVRIIGVIG